MGLRTASSVAVRGPYAEADEVMAPALTETAAAQSQTFKLPPVSATAAVIDDKEHRLEEPSSPKNGCPYVEKNGKSLFVRNNSTYNYKTPSSALQPLATHNHNNNNTTSCSDIVDDRNNSSLINGDDHSLKQNIDAVPPRTNKSLIIVRRSSSETTDHTLANNSHRTQDLQSIMSESPTHMGDQQTDEKMGLEKTTGMESVSKINNNSDKSSSEIDEQLLNNLTSIQSNDVDLPQNVDDLMQVFKSIDDNDRLINPPNDLLSLPAIEKFLRDDVDVMNMSMEEQQELEARNLKETQSAELIAELKKRQAKVERRLDFLRRKIHKLQARHMGQHVSGEIAGVFEYVHRSLRRLKETSVPDSSSTLLPQLPPSATDDLTSTTATTTTTSEPLKPMSYSSTKSLLKKLEVTAVMQANTTARQKPLNRYFGAGSSEPSNYKCTTNNVPGIVNIPPWPLEHKHELQKVSGLLRTELSVVQHEVDSEATESSSGGESCDEMQTYNNPHQQYLGIQKRALWKYATARAAIAARWTWLQAQIADLEYRIRQHTDIHRQIRAAKGEVVLGEAVADATSGGASPSVAGGTTTTTTPNITTVNGYRGQLPGNSPASLKSSSEVENGVSAQNYNNNSTSNSQQNDEDDHHHHDNNCQSSARTRPLVGFKKRRLVTLNGLHAISKKAARPSTLRCGCVTREAESCAVCTGRTDPAYPRDPPDALSKAERIALVDPGFHPVFSMSEDVSCGIHCDSIMKMTDWQQRSVRMKSMKVVKGERTSEKALIEQRAKNMEHRKKYGRVLKPSTASALSAKIKNKIRGRKVSRHYSSAYRLNRKRSSSSKLPSTSAGPGGGSIPYHHHQQSSTGAVSESGPDEEMEAIENNSHHHHHVSGSGSHHHQSHSAMASPSSSPLLHMQAISGYTSKKNRIDSYDIDNIVIPYSVAASTRVEKLQYKEILTPKWRIAEPDPKCDTKNNGAVKNPSQDSDTEDVTDDAVQMRHDRCEHDEKKKFLSYLKLPFGSYASTSSHHHHHHHHHRVRSHKQRTDSMAESSGANTPDPMSPHGATAADGATVSSAGAAAGQDNNGISPMTSPPATPSGSNVVDDLIGPLPSVSAMLRRRTISQSRYSRDRESNFNIYNSNREDNNSPENVEIPPYETRTFPLDGDSYDKMLKSMPEDYHQFKTNARAQDSVVNNTNGGNSNANLTTNASNLSGAGGASLMQNNDTSFRDDLSSYLDDKMDSPTGTESTESALGDEDPNDPEWMDVESKDYHRHGHHHHHKR